MKYKLLTIGLLLVLGLQSANATEEKLKVLVSGDINRTFIPKGELTLLNCDKDGRGFAQEVLTLMSVENKIESFNIKIPLFSATVGEHPVVGERDSASYKLGAISISYNQNIWQPGYNKFASGTVTFTNIPTKEGEHLKGTLKATIAKKKNKNKQVTLDATFDIAATSQTFTKCQ